MLDKCPASPHAAPPMSSNAPPDPSTPAAAGQTRSAPLEPAAVAPERVTPGAPAERATPPASRQTRSGAIEVAVVIAAALLHRFPAFLNAGAVNSDAAIVGLQALALLRGEWALHLWGSAYQTIPDVVLVAGLFKVFGPSPWAMFAVPWLGSAAVCALVFLMLRRCVSPWPAALATLTVAFGSQAITSPMTYMLRQTMTLVVVAGLWLLHRAAPSRVWPLSYFFGAALLGLGIFTDVFATIMWPAGALFALACCFDSPRSVKRVAVRVGVTLVGLIAGLVPAQAAGQLGGGATPGLSRDHLAATWPLLRDQCLPYALSTKVWMPTDGITPDLWQPGAPIAFLQLAAAVLVALLWLSGGALAVVRRIPWEARRLGLLGVATGSAALIGFLFSGAPADLWSVRYLAPLMWTLPFALAPVATLLRPRGFAVLIAPFLVSAAVGGWLSWGKFVHGPLPVLHARGAAQVEAELISTLLARGVTAGAAQYWLAYRLTLLSKEQLAIVPIGGEDRYPPYRVRFERAPKVAMIFHPSEPRALPEPTEAMLRGTHQVYEKFRLEDFTVFIVDRAPRPQVPFPTPAP